MRQRADFAGQFQREKRVARRDLVNAKQHQAADRRAQPKHQNLS